MELLFWLTFGVLGGWIISEVYDVRRKNGRAKDILLGIIGALYAGLLANILEFNLGVRLEGIAVFIGVVCVTVLIAANKVIHNLNQKYEEFK